MKHLYLNFLYIFLSNPFLVLCISKNVDTDHCLNVQGKGATGAPSASGSASIGCGNSGSSKSPPTETETSSSPPKASQPPTSESSSVGNPVAETTSKAITKSTLPASSSTSSPSKPLRCYTCEKKCEEQVPKMCGGNQNICVDFRYKDGTLEKSCLKDEDYQKIWNQKNKNHGGLTDETSKCKGDLCNNKLGDGLYCYKCYQYCPVPSIRKCSGEQNICVHFLWNVGSVNKACMVKKKFKLEYNKREKRPGQQGLDHFSYNCETNLCNTRKLNDYPQDRLVCKRCDGKCEEETDNVCTEKQDTCFSFFFKDGTATKGCVIGSNYQKVYDNAKEKNGDLKDESFKCQKNNCNAKKN